MVHKKLNAKMLTAEQLNKLNHLQIQHIEASKSTSNRFKHWINKLASLPKVSIAGILLVLGISTFFLNQQLQHQQMIYEIAQETAKNHLKMKPLEVKSGGLFDVRAYFGALDFSPVSSSIITQQDTFSLIGGRYCSIQGETAAQLRYINPEGEYKTLFETAYDKQKFQGLPNVDEGGNPILIQTQGIEVQIWIEKGLVMVSTSSL